MVKKKTAKDELKFDNEVRKLKLSMEYGMDFNNVKSDISPEIENQFLQHIESFEKQYAQRKITTVFKKIGEPEWKPVNEIPDDEIEKELEKLMTLMNKNGLDLDSICKVDSGEMYRFLTEELFKEEIDDMHLPGMTTNFIYEEFYPNHPYDIESRVKDFIKFLLDKKNGKDESYIKFSIDFHMIYEFDKNKAYSHIVSFKKSYKKIKLNKLKILTIQITEDKLNAEVEFEINFSALMADSTEKLKFEGKGTARLENGDGSESWWSISSIEMPGFKL